MTWISCSATTPARGISGTTTQTCRPAVWFLMRHQLTASKAQIAELAKLIGEKGSEAFFIVSGEVEVRAPGGAVVVTLRTRDYFGETAIFDDSIPRALDLVAIAEELQLYVLSKKDYEDVIAVYPECGEKIRKHNEPLLKKLKRVS